jgi:hypothetical protein
MEAESSQELSQNILEQIQALEIELEDGDITVKGFEKKKANILSQHKLSLETQVDLEPTAAEVTDFLDFLPSPTHSPRESRDLTNSIEQPSNHVNNNHSSPTNIGSPKPSNVPTMARPPSHPPYNKSNGGSQYSQQGYNRPISSQQMNPLTASPKPMFRPQVGNNGARPPPPYHGLPNSRPSSMDGKSYGKKI